MLYRLSTSVTLSYDSYLFGQAINSNVSLTWPWNYLLCGNIGLDAINFVSRYDNRDKFQFTDNKLRGYLEPTVNVLNH